MSKEWDLGPRVLGKERHAEVQLLKETTDEERLGSRVTGPLPAPVTAEMDTDRETASNPKSEGVSVVRLQEELAKEPELVGQYLALELARPDQRRTALKLMGNIEAKKAKPDNKILVEISEALERLDHLEDED